MSNVLIRDVPDEDLDQLRSAAARSGMSLQGYLRQAVRAQAAYLRRQAALARASDRLRGRDAVPPGERGAVLDAIDDAHDQRAGLLSGKQGR
jgi:plasmid stability protein